MKDATDITIILDKSGSMEAVRNDTIGGFNQFLQTQKAQPGEATLSLTTFNGRVRPLYTKPIKEASELSAETYQPEGSTALLDAIGRGILATGNRLSAIPEASRPTKVLFVIFTDGEENSSTEFDYKRVADMITHQEKVYNWQILFIGADQDAIAAASKLGVSASKALSVANNSAGHTHLYASLSSKVSMYRSAAGGQSVNSVVWDKEDRDEQKKAGSKH